MRGLDAQSETLKKNVGEIFGGLNIEPVLEGMSILVNLFDSSTEAGQAMKFLFEEIFQPIIDQATNAAYVVEAFFLGFLIGATKLYISLKPVIKTIGEVFGFEDTSLADTLDFAKQAGELLVPVVVIMAAAFAALAAVVVLVGGAIAGMIAGLVMLPQIISAAASAVWNGLVSAFNTAVDFIKGIDFVGIGASIMAGLAAGITGAASAVWNAITGAVSGAINAAKSMLGIASPSKVFADIGENTAAGMTGGVEGGASDVQGAMVDMVSPDEALRQAQLSGDVSAIASPVDAPVQGSAAGGGAGASFNLAGAEFNFYGVKDAEHAKELMGEMFTEFLEGNATKLGADPEALTP
jgi:phage-related protein